MSRDIAQNLFSLRKKYCYSLESQIEFQRTDKSSLDPQEAEGSFFVLNWGLKLGLYWRQILLYVSGMDNF